MHQLRWKACPHETPNEEKEEHIVNTEFTTCTLKILALLHKRIFDQNIQINNALLNEVAHSIIHK